MNIPISITAVLAGIVAIGAVYEIQNRHDAAQTELRTLQRGIDTAKRDIQVLKAEWSYQTRPKRLEMLAERLLTLRPTEAKQIAHSPADLARFTESRKAPVAARAPEATQ